MDTVKGQVISIATSRLNDLNIPIPAGFLSYVDEVEISILNYCNIFSVPRELCFTWVNMLVDYLKWVDQHSRQQATSSPKKSSTPTILSSLRAGDVTLGFSADTASAEYQASNAHKLADVLDQVVMNYADSLNRFRKVVW